MKLWNTITGVSLAAILGSGLVSAAVLVLPASDSSSIDSGDPVQEQEAATRVAASDADELMPRSPSSTAPAVQEPPGEAPAPLGTRVPNPDPQGTRVPSADEPVDTTLPAEETSTTTSTSAPSPPVTCVPQEPGHCGIPTTTSTTVPDPVCPPGTHPVGTPETGYECVPN